jgi:hypothetical protein
MMMPLAEQNTDPPLTMAMNHQQLTDYLYDEPIQL